MNIADAKEEIKNTVRAYLKKNNSGMYEIPIMRQRPVLLMGAPGLGKTAIMRQIAEETGIGFVSYNMTHHTRQSALGLPLIRKEEYGGRERDVTAYTMSEIVASIYEFMKNTGIKEGILFLDEINCVSETLTPVILQLLQAKTFGRERIPEGWVLVAAGNPEVYNRAVREFDMATLDRVRLIETKPDLETWKKYATSQNVHGAVTSYLDIHKENFYKAYITADGMNFVTARGWEDLSDLIKVYESLKVPVGVSQIIQFIHDPSIANDFANFYEMYLRYETAYMIDEIIKGGGSDEIKEKFRTATLDEQIAVLGLIIARLGSTFRDISGERAVSDRLFAMIKRSGDKTGEITFADECKALREEISAVQNGKVVSDESLSVLVVSLNVAEEWSKSASSQDDSGLEILRKSFLARNKLVENKADEICGYLDNVYDFLEAAGGDGTALVLFTTDLAAGKHSLEFLTEEGYERFFEYNKNLLI